MLSATPLYVSSWALSSLYFASSSRESPIHSWEDVRWEGVFLVVTLFCCIYNLDNCSHSGCTEETSLSTELHSVIYCHTSARYILGCTDNVSKCSVTNTPSCNVSSQCMFIHCHSAVHLSPFFPSAWLFHLAMGKQGFFYVLALPSSKQWFSTFLVLWSFNTIPHYVMTPNYKNSFHCYLLIILLLLLWNIM